MNDYMAGRQDGLQLALTIVEKDGIDGLRDEIKFRNATQIHTMLDRKSLEIATRKIKENDEGGTFYPGDDEKSYSSYGFFVNAWMPLPKPYREVDNE